MKKYNYSFLTFTLCLALLSGCGASTAEESDTQSEGVLFTARTEADLVETADTLEELVGASDFIAEISVTETSAYVYPGTDQIHTAIKPDVLEVYKGTYDGETLDIVGGYIDYRTYVSALVFEEDGISPVDVSAYTEAELDEAVFYYDWLNNYAPVVGDTLIFFGVRDDDGNYSLTYSYQGDFLTDGDTCTNQALIVADDSGWREPLVDDLLENCGAETVENDTAIAITYDGRSYNSENTGSTYDTIVSIPKDEFIAAIQEICG